MTIGLPESPDTPEGMPELLTSAEVARMLRMTPAGFRKMRAAGRGPEFIKLPTGAVRYDTIAVLKWLGAL